MMTETLMTQNNNAAASGHDELRPGAAASNVPRSHGRRVPLFVPQDELFFWTSKWQKGERDSTEGREAGEVVEFDSATDLLKWLLSDED